MKLPYQRTIERLDMIHKAKADGCLPFRVILSRVGDGSEIDSEFCLWVKQSYPLFEFSVFTRGSWIGQVDTVSAPPEPVGCVRWFDLSITASGVVAHCCMDGNADFPIGDVNQEHVLEIYNKSEYRMLRETLISRIDAHPCSECGFL